MKGEKQRSILSIVPNCYDFTVCSVPGAEVRVGGQSQSLLDRPCIAAPLSTVALCARAQCYIVGGSSPLLDVFLNYGSRTFSLSTVTSTPSV
jgi:hypothetical protein